MDAARFDAFSRSLTALGSRRSALATALAGGLGTLTIVSTEAKKKKKCSPCKKRKKGKCKKNKPDGTVCEDGTCQGGRCVASPGCGAGGPCLVFLSSTLHLGNLGGLSGGDTICQGLATTAGLPGIYKAWLSDDTSSVISRFVPSSGPYRLVNGTTIATSFTDLTDGTLLTLINVTETGGASGATLAAWTGTLPNGNATTGASFTCANWSAGGIDGIAGLVTRSDAGWTLAGDILCSERNHLYCFQQS
jgi:hypothetical protein